MDEGAKGRQNKGEQEEIENTMKRKGVKLGKKNLVVEGGGINAK